MIKLPKILRGITAIKASRFLFLAFLFCLPFQIRTFIYGGSAFYTGNFSAYTTFFFYLTDLLLACSLILYGVAIYLQQVKNILNFGDEKLALMLSLLMIIALGSIFFSPDKVLTFLMIFRLLLFGFLYLMVVNDLVSRDELLKWLIIGIVFQALIAILQYTLQQSVGLYFLGESHITPQSLNVAKIDWDGMKILRAYGTFAHANILGGALFMTLIMAFYRFRNNLKIMIPVVAVLTAALIFTFSRSAFFALIAAFLVYIAINENKTAFKYIILGFSMLVFFIVAFNLEDIFFQRFLMGGDPDAGLMRLKYLDMSIHMLINHPFGVGMGGYVFLMQNYSLAKLEPWIFQPAHNVFMMVANELGIIGIAIFVFLLGYIFFVLVKNVSVKKGVEEERMFGFTMVALLAGIVTIAFFDHYFYTIYQGQVFLIIFLALVSGYLKKAALPLKKS